MKRKYLFLLMLSYLSGTNAQVLNPSFENWTTKQNEINVAVTYMGFTGTIDDPQFTYNEIVDWSSLNQLTGTESLRDPATANTDVELVTKNNVDFVDGMTSVKLETKTVEIIVQTSFGPVPFENEAPGMLISGDFDLDENAFANQLVTSSDLQSLNPFTYRGTGHAIDFQPAKLYGSYKYTGLSGDSALMVSGLIKNRVVVAYVIKKMPNATTWTNFELEYEYLACEMPDTIVTLFCSSNLDASFDNGNFYLNSSYTGVNGSFLMLDNLHLDTIDINSFPPIAINDTSEIFEGQVVLREVLLNDNFCGATSSSPVISVNGVNGNAIVTANNELEYTPNNGFYGSEQIEYFICKAPNVCDTAVWHIKVNQIVPCIANDDTRSLNKNETVVFDATANDDNCATNPTIISIPLNGTADVESNGNISYSPVNDFVGMDSLTYTVCSLQNANQCDTAKVYYTILTSVKEIPASFISIAPNPAKDLVKIKIDNYTSTKIVVYNMLGNKMYNDNFHDYIELNTKSYPTGVYLVQLENSLGSAVRKLVIAK